MLSRWNFCRAVTLANARLGPPRASYSVCLAKRKASAPVRRPQAPGYGHDRVAEGRMLSSSRHSSGELPPPTPPPPPPSSSLENDHKSQSLFQRFKSMAKKYWYVVLPVHVVTSTVWFGSFYFMASCGVDVPALLESLGSPDWITDKVRNGNSWTSYLVIAYGLYKIFTPLRYMVTIGGSTVVIRYLQRIGYAIGGSTGPKKP